MKKIKNYERNLGMLAPLTPEQYKELAAIEREAIANFFGPLDELESALGMLHIGHHVGWKVLALVHNKRTLRKYEDVLNIHVREFFPEEGPSADRNYAYKLIKKVGNYWKAVSGDFKVENKRDIA